MASWKINQYIPKITEVLLLKKNCRIIVSLTSYVFIVRIASEAHVLTCPTRVPSAQQVQDDAVRPPKPYLRYIFTPTTSVADTRSIILLVHVPSAVPGQQRSGNPPLHERVGKSSDQTSIGRTVTCTGKPVGYAMQRGNYHMLQRRPRIWEVPLLMRNRDGTGCSDAPIEAETRLLQGLDRRYNLVWIHPQ